MTLKQLLYETDFYWKGVRYTQVIRPKSSKGRFVIVCRPARGQGKWIDMPWDTEVKPVLTLQEFRKLHSQHVTLQ